MSTRFATLYNSLSEKRHPEFGTYNTEETMTVQSDKDSTDINLIVKRYEGTGMLPQVQMQALTGDFTGITDFHDAQQRILEAKEAFMEVPAAIRDRFNNDPQSFVDFVTNPDNIDELRKLGLANALPETQTPPIPAISPEETEYNDDGERTRYTSERREVDAAGGARTVAGEGRTALRQPQGVRAPGDREPGRNGPSGGRS